MCTLPFLGYTVILSYLVSCGCRGQRDPEASCPQSDERGGRGQTGGLVHITHDQSQRPTAIGCQAVPLHL